MPENILSDATINLLIPDQLPTVEELEQLYPARQLPEGAWVTRVAPSPTGSMHIGTVMASLINERLAHQSGGKFYVRIEDTDTKRTVEGAVGLIIRGVQYFGINPDEYQWDDGTTVGSYGPYFQSDRVKIYKAYIKHFIKIGRAYPCFVSQTELDEMRKSQEAQSIRPGYYGRWALHRNLTEAEVLENLKAKKPFVIRFKSMGNIEKRVKFTDLIKGDRDLPQNDIDTVILKSNDDLPTYHFAHLVDDHLMGTTHVLRGDEWFSSMALHLELFDAMGWRRPKYGHLSPIEKLDNGARRKLSKRKDPEASVDTYIIEGYTKEAVLEYLINLANSNFEDWRKCNQTKSLWEFPFSIKKMGESGAIYDIIKLDNISKNVVARLSAQEIYDASFAWAGQHDAKLKALMDAQPDYVRAILSIERTGPKVRKDIVKWADLYNEVAYFFDEHFALTKAEAISLLAPMDAAEVAKLVAAYESTYNHADNRDEWFAKVKAVAAANGYAANPKEQQANPTAFKGNVSDVAKILRVLLTGRVQTPDLWSIMQVMGQERLMRRLALAK